jgi:putative redox protein
MGRSSYILIRTKESLVKILFPTGVLAMADINEVVVRGNAAGFAQEIIAGRHRLMADEPVAAGGSDSGPTPYDLLLAALGA